MQPDPKRVTAEGDIVIKLTSPFDAAVVEGESVGCIIPSFCAIIKNTGDLDFNYLCAFLNSLLCKDQLKARVTGAVMSVLSVGKIIDIDIPVPELDVQMEIGKQYIRSQNKKRILNKIIEFESMRNDAVFQELVK